MAIKNRRGPYNKFDPTKLLPGEWAVVLSGDPNASDGLACYMCFGAGVVKRMATYEDMVDNIAASSGEVVAAEVDRQCKAAIQACQTATSNAGSAASAANTAAGNANTAVSEANTAANSANTAATAANEAAQAAQNVIQGDLSSNTVTFTTASTRTNILSGESLAVMFGKIKKWLSSLKNAAFADVANNLTTSAEGSVLDARQGKALQDKIGSTDISGIGNGTVTGAVSALNTKIGNAGSIYTNEVTVTGSGSWVTAADITVPPGKYIVIRRGVSTDGSDVLCGESYDIGKYASGSGGALAEYINTYNLTTQSDMTVFYYAGSGNSVKLSITAIAI